MDCRTPSDSYKHKQRIIARHLARRSSDGFCDTYGDSTALDSIAPFERDEIILGRRIGSGSFSAVYEIGAFHLRSDRSSVYTKKQVMMREATAKSAKNGAKFVMKCLKEEVEESDDKDLFLNAAQDISHEAEMLAALSHPNIVSLHGITASRHDAFPAVRLLSLSSSRGLSAFWWTKLMFGRRRRTPSTHRGLSGL
jgi:serine/threonine protein kinase